VLLFVLSLPSYTSIPLPSIAPLLLTFLSLLSPSLVNSALVKTRDFPVFIVLGLDVVGTGMLSKSINGDLCGLVDNMDHLAG